MKLATNSILITFASLWQYGKALTTHSTSTGSQRSKTILFYVNDGDDAIQNMLVDMDFVGASTTRAPEEEENLFSSSLNQLETKSVKIPEISTVAKFLVSQLLPRNSDDELLIQSDFQSFLAILQAAGIVHTPFNVHASLQKTQRQQNDAGIQQSAVIPYFAKSVKQIRSHSVQASPPRHPFYVKTLESESSAYVQTSKPSQQSRKSFNSTPELHHNREWSFPGSSSSSIHQQHLKLTLPSMTKVLDGLLEGAHAFHLKKAHHIFGEHFESERVRFLNSVKASASSLTDHVSVVEKNAVDLLRLSSSTKVPQCDGKESQEILRDLTIDGLKLLVDSVARSSAAAIPHLEKALKISLSDDEMKTKPHPPTSPPSDELLAAATKTCIVDQALDDLHDLDAQKNGGENVSYDDGNCNNNKSLPMSSELDMDWDAIDEVLADAEMALQLAESTLSPL